MTNPVPSSKLPKFLRTSSSSTRDRPTSVAETSAASLADSSSKARKSRFLSRRSPDAAPDEPDPPVIVEPVSIPRPRRALTPPSPSPSPSPPHISLSTSTSRISDLPTRLSGWFSHTFSSSSTDLSLPSLLASTSSASTSFVSASPPLSSSPKRSVGASALLAAAKHGKGHLDKAMRYLLDSDATPDKCTDPIWILGVKHPGWEPPPLSSSTRSLRPSVSTSNSTSNLDTTKPATPQWPAVFYADFTSRVWLTYRSHFTPIRDIRLGDLDCVGVDPAASASAVSISGRREREDGSVSPVIGRRSWGWGTAEKGWTSDSGWGCMLRTGQSLLANALVHLHLGRDWRRPPYPVPTADYATYVQILTWFFDTPAPEAPFSVHRMALAGKELGKDVGQWFAPSTAAGAIKSLVNAFPDAGLGVVVATDGVLFQTEVFSASHTGGVSVRSPRTHHRNLGTMWGDRPVLLLIGVRLGLDGVNPIYYDTIKMLYTFPQSVGIAGGRPSSSYYFVGSQADNLFYLDPHHARPAIALRPAPTHPHPFPYHEPEESDTDTETRARSPPPNRASTHSPSGSSTFSHHAPLSPSPLQQQFSTSGESTVSVEGGAHVHGYGKVGVSRSPSFRHTYTHTHTRPHTHPTPYSHSPQAARFRSSSVSATTHSSASAMHESELRIATGGGVLGPIQEHYVTAYPASELKTYHCDRVRKMSLGALDPSMLIGFLCRDLGDWEEFRRRVGELPRMVFSVQEEPPLWAEDVDDVGLESISEPDPDEVLLDVDDEDEEDEDEDEEEEEEEDREQYFDTRSASSGGIRARARGTSEEVDTEEDPVDPITPLPSARFTIVPSPLPKRGEEDEEVEEMFDEEDGEGDIEDDWVDPSVSVPTPIPSDPPLMHVPATDNTSRAPAAGHANTNINTKMPSLKQTRKGRKEVPVPVPLVKVPVPSMNRSSSQSQGQQEHYPFPVTQREVSPTRAEHRLRHTSNSNSNKGMGKRMHMARARDGGRTQSGGVKGVLTDG